MAFPGEMLKVYLFRGKHPLYETMLSHPPDGVEYVPRRSRDGIEEYSLYSPYYSMIRKLSDQAFSALGTPRRIPIIADCDLVHSSRGFLVLGPHPFVVDFEQAASFVGMQHRRLDSQRMRRSVARAVMSKKCKALLPHCEAAARSLATIAPEKSVSDKMRVVYPVVDTGLCSAARVPEDPPRLLFIGEYYWKGGREVIEACMRLSDKLDFSLTFITIRVHPPAGVVEKAKSKLRMEYIQGPIPRKTLFEEVYPRSDIFVMPTYLDTFGYAFLEAMAFGLPCIGTRHFAVPEIVQDGANGLLVDPVLSYFDEGGIGHPEYVIERASGPRTVDQLCTCISDLVQSHTLRSRMGAEGKRMVEEGRFSVSRRNSILKQVYEASLSA